MSVHIRKDGAWIVRYREAGKECTRYFGKGQDAQADARAFNASLGLRDWQRRTAPQGALTFGELARLYVEASPTRMEISSISALVYKLNGRILPVITAEPVATITASKLDQYVSYRLRQGYTRKPGGMVRYPRLSTVRREVTDIISILHWGVSRGYLSMFPAVGYRKPQSDDAVIQPPTPEEIKRLLQEAPEHLYRALCLSWYTGIRPGGELLGLRYDAIDWQSKTIFVESAKKHGPRSRTIAIHPRLFELLEKWRKVATCQWIVNYRGEPVSCIKISWQKAKIRAGITRRLRLYDLRHSFATAAIRATGDIRAVSAVLGHSRPETTIRFYSHTSPERERQIVENIEPVTDL